MIVYLLSIILLAISLPTSPKVIATESRTLAFHDLSTSQVSKVPERHLNRLFFPPVEPEATCAQETEFIGLR